jgi:hypothetical protein
MVLLEKVRLEKIGPEKIMLEKIMRTVFIALVLTAGLAYGPAQAQETDTDAIANVSNGGQSSLRGLIELDVTRPADAFKKIPRDRAPYASARDLI